MLTSIFRSLAVLFFCLSVAELKAQCPQNIDQQVTSSNTGTWGNSQWQSFTAGQTGKLTQIDLLKNGCETYSYTLNIYSGTGTGGTLLYSNTYSYNTCSVWINMAIPIATAPNVIAGNVYTFELVLISSSSGSPLGFVAHTGNIYSGGTYFSSAYGAQANWDLNFRTYVTNPNAPTATSTVLANVTCNGGSNGSITATGAGGTSPYSFSWSPAGGTTSTASGLIAGAYTVTITDINGCTASSSSAITQPPALTLTTGVTNVTCNGGANGAINLVVAGGTPPYTFNWGGGITTEDRTGLVAGTYSVTVTDANGCISSTGATVTQPAPLSLSTTTINALCFGNANGSIDLTVTGGTPGYTYFWAGGFTTQDRTGLAAGTYSVTVTDANSCTGTTSAIITQPTAISFGTTVTNVTCNGGSDGAINLTPTGGTPAYTFNWGGGITTEDRTLLAAGTYSVTTTDANGCTASVSATVTQPAVFIPNAGVDVVICNGGSTMLSGSGALSYSWSPATGLSSTTIANPVANPASTTTYTLTGTNSFGCVGTDVVLVTVNPIPTANAGIDQTICGNSTATLNGSIGGSATSLIWSTTGTGSFSSISSPSTVYTPSTADIAAGFVTLTITTDDPAGPCTPASDAMILTINNPAVANAGTDLSICFSGSVVLGGSIIGGTSSGSWSGGSGTFSPSNTSLTATYTPVISSGVETLTLTSADPDGIGPCTSVTDQMQVTVFALPMVSHTTLSPICENAAAIVLSGGTPAGGIYSGTGVSAGNFDPAIAGAGTHFISYSFTDGNGCTNSANPSITVNPTPIVSFSPLAPICGNGSAITLTGGTPAGGIYSGTAVSAGIFDPLISGSGSFPITYTFTDANGCTNFATQIQNVSTIPVVNFSPLTDICSNAPAITLNQGNPIGGTYSGSGIIGASFSPSSAGLGPHTLTYSFTDANGCTNTANQTITVLAAPVVSFSSLTPVCADAANFTLTQGSPAGGVYSGTGVSAGSFSAATSGSGTFTITYIYTDANSCSDTAAQNQIVNPIPTVIFPAPSSMCVNDAPLTLTGSTPAGGVYSGTGITGGVFSPAASGTGNFVLTYSYTDSEGCFNSAQQIIVVNSIPTVTAGPDQVYCEGSPVALSASGALTYMWSPAGGLSSVSIPNPLAQPLSTTTYTVTGTDANGCSASDNVIVSFVPQNSVSAGPDQVICLGSSIQLFANGGSSYLWTGTDILNPNTDSPTVNPDSTTTYYLQVITPLGCLFVDSVLVTIDRSDDCIISEFNSFSPEGDGVNDTWIISNISAFPDNKVSILNRWGNTLVEIEDYNNLDRVWNGEYQGEILPTGTYYFIIQTFGPERVQTGWVFLSR